MSLWGGAERLTLGAVKSSPARAAPALPVVGTALGSVVTVTRVETIGPPVPRGTGCARESRDTVRLMIMHSSEDRLHRQHMLMQQIQCHFYSPQAFRLWYMSSHMCSTEDVIVIISIRCKVFLFRAVKVIKKTHINFQQRGSSKLAVRNSAVNLRA